MLWVIVCTVHLFACSYHVKCMFQSESTLYKRLNVKVFLAPRRHHIWRLSGFNKIRTHNNLVRKRTLNHLTKQAKWLSCVVNSYLCGGFDSMSYHLTYAFLSESTLCKCLNFKELLARSRHHIWRLSYSNETLRPNHLVRKGITKPFSQTSHMIELWCE